MSTDCESGGVLLFWRHGDKKNQMQTLITSSHLQFDTKCKLIEWIFFLCMAYMFSTTLILFFPGFSLSMSLSIPSSPLSFLLYLSHSLSLSRSVVFCLRTPAAVVTAVTVPFKFYLRMCIRLLVPRQTTRRRRICLPKAMAQ